jgi:hypothetical protein
MPTDLRFDQFNDGGNVQSGDIVVGLRGGLNTFFAAGTLTSQNANAVTLTGGSLTNIAINSCNIGQVSPALGSFTALTASTVTTSGAAITGGSITTTAINTCSINGSSIDSTVIGAATPDAGTFTNLTANTLFSSGNVAITGGTLTGVTINNAVIGGTTPAAGTFTTAKADDVTTKRILLTAKNSGAGALSVGQVVTSVGDDAVNGVPTVKLFANPGIDAPRGVAQGAVATNTVADFIYRGRMQLNLGTLISGFPTILYVQPDGSIGTALTGTRAGEATALISGTTYAVDIDFDTITTSDVVAGIRTESASTYTLQAADNGQFVVFTFAGDVTVTLPQSSTTVLPAGFTCYVICLNGIPNTLTVAKQGSDALNGEARIAQGQWCQITKTVNGSPNTWVVNASKGGSFNIPSGTTYTISNPVYSSYVYAGTVPITITLSDLTLANAPTDGHPLSFKNESLVTAKLNANGGTTAQIVPPGQGALIVPTASVASGNFKIFNTIDYNREWRKVNNNTAGTLNQGVVVTPNGYASSPKCPAVKALTSPGTELALGILIESLLPGATTQALLVEGMYEFDWGVGSLAANTPVYVQSSGSLGTTQTAQFAGWIISSTVGTAYNVYINLNAPISRYANFTAGSATGLTSVGATTATFSGTETSTLKAHSPNFGDYATNILAATYSSILGGTANTVSGAGLLGCTVLNGNSNSITDPTLSLYATILNGIGNTMTGNCTHSLVLNGAGHVLTGAAACVIGGGNPVTATHDGGIYYNTRGSMSSTADNELLFDMAGGYTFKGPTVLFKEGSTTLLSATTTTATLGLLSLTTTTASMSLNSLLVESSNGSGDNSITISNTSNTSPAGAGLKAKVAGSSGFDPYTQWIINGVNTATMGLDNSDSDKLKMGFSTSLGSNDMWVMTSAGEITTPKQPCFLATLSTTKNNVTGAGTTYQIVCDNELFDANGDYNSGTGQFVAPVTGIYQFWSYVTFTAVVTGTVINIDFLTSIGTFTPQSFNTSVKDTANNIQMEGLTPPIQLAAGDTVNMRATVSGGGGNTTNILGTGFFTLFAGRLVG